MKKIIPIIILAAITTIAYVLFYKKEKPAPVPVQEPKNIPEAIIKEEVAPPPPPPAPIPGQFGFVITEKELVPGKLVPTGKINKLSGSPEMQRVNPIFYIYVKDKVTMVETKVEVTEKFFNSTRRGEVYSEIEIKNGRKF